VLPRPLITGRPAFTSLVAVSSATVQRQHFELIGKHPLQLSRSPPHGRSVQLTIVPSVMVPVPLVVSAFWDSVTSPPAEVT